MKSSVSFHKVTTAKDIAETARLARIIWTEHFSDMIGKDIVQYLLETLQSEKAIKLQIQDEYAYYLIQAETNYVGYFAVQHQRQEQNMFLSKLYILNSERGKGYGKSALSAIEKMAQNNNCCKISLTVYYKNRNSIAAYEKMGFYKTGSIRRDVGNGIIIHDLTMEKIMTDPREKK